MLEHIFSVYIHRMFNVVSKMVLKSVGIDSPYVSRVHSDTIFNARIAVLYCDDTIM